MLKINQKVCNNWSLFFIFKYQFCFNIHLVIGGATGYAGYAEAYPHVK